MPRDIRGEKVEGFKLTDQMKNWTKQFKATKRMHQMLQGATLIEKSRVDKLKDLWRYLAISYEGLKGSIPEEQLRELQGMNFGQEQEQPTPGPEQGQGGINY